MGFVFSFFLFIFHLMFFYFFLLFFYSGYVISFSFLSMFDLDLEFVFVFDFLSLSFSSFILLISSIVFIYSDYYMMGDLFYKRFLLILFMFVISMMILVFGFSFFSIMVGWDGLGLVSFFLVIYYNNFTSLKSGLLTVLSNRAGDLGMLFSFYYLFLDGSWSYLNFSFGDVYLLCFFLIFASMTKSAQFPFSAWLPSAMSAPTPVSSLVHSSTLVTAGVYLLIRYYYSLSFFFSSFLFCVLSLFTMFFSGLLAVFDSDIKSIVAMSTLSQLGFMMFSISFGEWILGFFHMLCHALYKSLLFLSCGSFIILGSGSQDLRFKGGLSFSSPFMFIIFVFSSFSLFGFPFLTGFFSKDFILEFSFIGGWGFIFMLILVFSCSFSLVYSLRVFFWGLFFYNMFTSGVSFLSMSKVLYFMFILFFWSLFWGYFLGSLMFFDSLFFVFSFFKVFTFFVFILGFVFFIVFISFTFGFFSLVFSDFFFLYSMSSFFSSYFSKFWVNFSSYDLFWLEFFGPKVFLNFNFLSYFLLGFEKSFSKFFYLFLGLVFICLFFFFFWF
uniref:NADH:ubiquinone reductase (H(+)-translocating) n=1 Tax=Unionicola parkeri TaxID=350891 RepID=E3W3L9_9ACAR|nr:NADH dehydrogenase subunit 5 [Unionicola parkeri]ADP01829.1 NADH dehydrogenase subunit 5 [Unionicola parkeri]